MTEPEVEACEAQLTRVWGEPIRQQEMNFTWDVPGGRIRTKAYPTYTAFQLDVRGLSLYASTGGVFLVAGEPNQGAAHWASEQHEALRPEWMPLFRRGCWLSGVPIEASAHEKAEWMRDFTKGEVEAWNLKM